MLLPVSKYGTLEPPVALHTKTQPRPQDAQAQTVEKGIDSNDSQKSALGPRANAMTPLASHQSSLPNAAKGYPPREPREPTSHRPARSAIGGIFKSSGLLPAREGETIEGSRTMRNRPYPVLKCSSCDLGRTISSDALSRMLFDI